MSDDHACFPVLVYIPPRFAMHTILQPLLLPADPTLPPIDTPLARRPYRVLEIGNGSGATKQILSGFSRPCLVNRLHHHNIHAYVRALEPPLRAVGRTEALHRDFKAMRVPSACLVCDSRDVGEAWRNKLGSKKCVLQERSDKLSEVYTGRTK